MAVKKDPPDIKEPEDTDEDPKFVTVEQLNAAITGKLKEFNTRLSKQLETTLADSFTKLSEKLAPPAKEEGEDRVAKLAKELEDERKARNKLVQDLADRDAKAKRADERKQLTTALAKAGITTPALQNAAALALEERLIRGEDDAPVKFRIVNKYNTDEDVDVDAGVAAWAKTAEGKEFIPSRQVRGTGGGPSPLSPSRNTQATPDQRKAEERQDAKRVLAEAFLGVARPSEE